MIRNFIPASLIAIVFLVGCAAGIRDIELTTFPPTPVEYRNYEQVYHPIEGPQPAKFPDGFEFRFSAVEPQPDGSVVQRLNETWGSAIKWEAERHRGKTQGRYVTETTFSEVWPGVVYAPLWLYSEGSAEGGHEFDFEYMNGRLEYNLHNGNGGFRMRSVEKDLGGHRVRWMIERRPGRVTMTVLSLTDGWTDKLVVRRATVAQWAQQKGAPASLRFPPDSIAMFPLTELWRCQTPSWCGTWQPLAPDQTINMTVHGYRFSR
ncbi:MAG: hypothetical protein FP825_14150 [Hyphomonas sp.]|uniref:hypothetical protein n=1 Tax=Hyphomonas sp. TaxID=87 RepID=UPI0017B3666B|nr:hypothetical protein [Hyphomonas sp.]MBU3918987.1 hypothetical protein [Alphaproteobacteria bacterium]MBA3069611.1 hypothetical protein [Hyphomonas sp.]MBU4063228.1 hypothetical protein [Alphaproteobacteria bacterium]MBU4164046.1 hypothetical protein [Alphaproteobacteria bacterium]MBU4569503.1 hypothetical protein [Alphaproteobacteria bacterium]